MIRHVAEDTRLRNLIIQGHHARNRQASSNEIPTICFITVYTRTQTHKKESTLKIKKKKDNDINK